MDTQQKNIAPFIVKDCSIVTIATGISAGSLVDMREKILAAPNECLYYHFWVSRLRPFFVPAGFNNDFALWAYHVLNEPALAERLSLLDLLRFSSLEELKEVIVGAIDKTLDEKNFTPWAKREDYFQFISFKMIVMPTLKTLKNPKDLLSEIDHISFSSLFYHFIEARRQTKESIDDFSAWLKNFDPHYYPLIEQFLALEVNFLTLEQIKHKLSKIINDFFKVKHELS